MLNDVERNAVHQLFLSDPLDVIEG